MPRARKGQPWVQPTPGKPCRAKPLRRPQVDLGQQPWLNVGVVSSKTLTARRLLALAIPLALILTACGPSRADIEAIVATRVASVPTATPQSTATPQPTSTPIVLPTPAPAPTPQPTSTPQPTPTLVPIPTPLPTPTPQPTPTPVVFPTPLPTATPVFVPTTGVLIVPPASGPAAISLAGSVVLRIDPGQPRAGRDISFAIEGLKPWQRFSVGFVDPLGVAAEWITPQEVPYRRSQGVPVVTETLYADANGKASWVRIGTKDSEGMWSLRLTVDGVEYPVSYPVSNLQLETSPAKALGLDFRLYQGTITRSYFSPLVPSALALDLQGHLRAVVDRMRDRLGIQSGQIPALYLLGNRPLLEAAAKAAGVELTGWEAGFYRVREPYPGIYIVTDSFVTGIKKTLTHEYVHLLLAEVAPSTDLPAWVNEGAATYYELSLGLELGRPDVTRWEIFDRTDTARSAALVGKLASLPSLESQRLWNQQSDKALVQLQYSEAYMAVRYFVERNGEAKLKDLLSRLASGTPLGSAVQATTGMGYDAFERDFVAWLRAWQDPQREAVRAYVTEALKITAAWDSLMQERSKEMASNQNLPLSSRVVAKQALVTTVQGLQQKADQLVAPSIMGGIHSDLVTFLKRGVQWLQLELDWVTTGVDSKRLEANGMIPEIDARESGVQRALSDVRYSYVLQ